jgi:hypothetical protein
MCRPITGIINEPRQTTIGDEQMRTLFVFLCFHLTGLFRLFFLTDRLVPRSYYKAYKEMREITSVGRGNGPVIALFDGFYRHWKGFLKGGVDGTSTTHAVLDLNMLVIGADRVGMDIHLYQAFNSRRPDIQVAAQIKKVSPMRGRGLYHEVLMKLGCETVVHKHGSKSQQHGQTDGYHICWRMVTSHEW